jgi:glycosyltransferase involved in cell wall biosynthesis
MQRVPQLIPSYIAPSAWWEHVPIAHWLIATLKPPTVVELGTHYGVSFFAFCQAAKQFSTGSFIYAIDTWAGDEHAGQYSDEIYNQVHIHQQQHYRQVSSLLRQSFDEAATYFADDSIDLLHIDGLHTYDAVSHDHETWLEKLRGDATILFHDINVRERDFGVWQLWREIQADSQFHCLEVLNGSGLGIATRASQAPTWHEEFRHHRESLQSSGALYLELAIKHLSRQELEGQYAALAAELQAMKHLHAADPGSSKAGSKSSEAGLMPGTEPVPGRSLASRSIRKLHSGATHVGEHVTRKRYQLRGLLGRVASKVGLIKKKNLSQHKPSKQPRVTFISGEPHTPGHRYRVLRLAEAYAASGAKVTILKPTEIISNIQQIEDCDILSLWRIGWSADLQVAVSACKSKGGFVLFDVDDLMIRPELAKAKVIDAIRSNGFDEGKTAELFAQMQRSMLAADLCLTTTEELANQMRLYGKPVMVVANGYNEDTFASSRLAYREHQRNRPSDVVRIGYASGSLTHQKDFQSCSQAVARILQENPQCRLVLFHDDNNTRCLDIHEFPGLEAVRDQIEWRLLVPLEKLPQELARFDINIIPLETNNVFTEAKSELKFFEAALAGSCSIASPTGPFRRIISSGANGFLAATPEEWYEQLQALVSNPQLRQHFAAAALADIMFAYSPVRRSQQISRIAAYATNPSLRATIFQTIVQEEREPRPRQGPFIPEHDIIFHSDKLKKSSTTVVIPLYNYSQYIEETLNSVKLQTLANIDLIVVNDHSTDDSLRKAKRWMECNKNHFNRAIIASNKINSKLGPSRNVGFHLAETDYIFALDADNRLDRECLQSCLAAAQQSKAAFIYPTLQEFGASNGQIGGLEYTPIKLISGNYIDAMALVSKAAWQQVGGYRNIRHGWEDYDLWCRFAEAGLHAQHLAGKPMAYYRVHRQSMLRTTTDECENKKELICNLESLHPWLQISTPPPEEQEQNETTATAPLHPAPLHGSFANQALEPNPDQDLNRLASLLPILRCPRSHRCLKLEGAQLRSGDDEQSETWPLLRGVPNLFPGLNQPEIRDEQHISHPLPEHLLQKIKGTSGRVLNLSAGGSAEKLDNVVEVEFALFRNTDIVADAHTLPFVDECFAGIISMNAFEHYHDPELVVAELMRVLKPGGWLVVQTAFLQPEHEYPWHFYNTTSEGLKRWFSAFNLDELRVSDNFNPLYALSWLASECEQALHSEISGKAAHELRNTTLTTLVDGWRQGKLTQTELWQYFRTLPQASQRPIAAGFELIATKPYPDPPSG